MILFYVFLLLFCPLLNAFVPQEWLSNAQQVYTVLMKKNQPETIDIQKTNGPHLLKQARKIAKQKGDVEDTQELTQRIIEAQRNFWERHPRLIALTSTVVSSAIFFFIGYRWGVYHERHIADPFGD